MKLLWKGLANLPAYHSNDLDLHLQAGQTCDVSDAVGSMLMADFSGAFVEVNAESPAQAQDIPAAPRDKQIKEVAHRGRPRK